MDNKEKLDIINAKRMIVNNIMIKLDKNDPNYMDIMIGGNMIWSKYYKQALLGNDTYENIVSRLNKDCVNDKYISTYINKFGILWKI